MAYSIGEFARLSGITATTLRAWQRRYGLLKPQRTEGGHRQYSDEDVQQALKILDWVKKRRPDWPGQTAAGAPYVAPDQQLAHAAADHVTATAGRQNRVPAPDDLRRRTRVPKTRTGRERAASATQSGIGKRRRRHDPAGDPRRHHHRLHLVLPGRR